MTLRMSSHQGLFILRKIDPLFDSAAKLFVDSDVQLRM